MRLTHTFACPLHAPTSSLELIHLPTLFQNLCQLCVPIWTHGRAWQLITQVFVLFFMTRNTPASCPSRSATVMSAAPAQFLVAYNYVLDTRYSTATQHILPLCHDLKRTWVLSATTLTVSSSPSPSATVVSAAPAPS